ncbi:MAG: amidohydrolase family protein [Planctomycetota bacterium]
MIALRQASPRRLHAAGPSSHTLRVGLALLCGLCPAMAQDDAVALRGATVHPVAGPPIEGGVVIFAGGKIQAIGDGQTPLPAGATVIDCEGAVITPGLVDAATALGVSSRDANEQGDEVTPHLHIVDVIDPAAPAFRRARRAGVTTAQVSPGNRNAVGGLGAVVKTRGDTVADMLVRDETCLRVTLGSEPSAGNRPIRFGTPATIYYRRPNTRMGVVWAIRKAFYDAMAYRDRKTVPEEGEPAASDAGMEVLLQALERKLQVRTTARAEQDIRTALRLAAEFGYETVVEEATEAWRVADDLAAAQARVVFAAPSADSSTDGAKPRWHSLNALAAADVPFAIATGSNKAALDLIHEVTFAVRNGLDRDAALASVTLEPARILGVAERVGSLEAGKDADLVVWSGDPFDPSSRPTRVYIDGKEVQ